MRARCEQLIPTQCYQVGSLKSAVDGAFTPQELTNAVKQDFSPPENKLLNTCQHTTYLDLSFMSQDVMSGEKILKFLLKVEL